jgi:hypothetical protein
MSLIPFVGPMVAQEALVSPKELFGILDYFLS